MLRQPGPEDVDLAGRLVPNWQVVLRGLREAAGITQEGWAAHLGYGRRTVQRWERGESPPDAAATEALVTLCAERRLFRTFHAGDLADVTVTPELLRRTLEEARMSRRMPQRSLPQISVHRELAPLMELIPDASLRIPQHNLPSDLTSFIGREAERSAIVRLVADNRLVTLVGSGGVGKTRLATVVARDTMSAFSDGVWLVELADLRQPSMVVQRMAAVVGVREKPDSVVGETLVETLRRRHLLLILDNAEHLVRATAELATRLLQSCPGVHVVATSREPLGVPGEVVWRVPSLDLPGDGQMLEASRAGRAASVRLFVDRAAAHLPGFKLTDENTPSVSRVCRRLEGIPLAIELAAAWARVLTPAEIETRLDHQFDLLTSQGSLSPSRQQTLRASMDWSYALLEPDEQHLFDRLSIFPGAFFPTDVEKICTINTAEKTFELLARLVDKSLVLADPLRNDQITRYHLLDSLRVYSAERLFQRGESEELHRAHAQWFAAQAIQAEDAVHGSEQRFWLRWIDEADANIREALEWSLSHDVEIALRVCSALAWPWGALGHTTEARSWLERTLEHPQSTSYPRWHARLMALLSMMNVLRGDLPTAMRLREEATAADAGREDPITKLIATVAEVQILQDSGDPRAIDLAEYAMRVARSLNNHWYIIRLTEIQARGALRRRDIAAATTLLEEGVRLARRAEDQWSLAQVLNNLGDVARSSGNHAEAGAMYEESLALRATLGVPGLNASLQHNLGYVALAAGDIDKARTDFRTAMWEFTRTNDRRGIAECLIGMASVESAEGRYEAAAKKFGAGSGALKALGASIWPANRADVERWQRLAQESLGDDAFNEIFDAALRLSLDAALDLADATLRSEKTARSDAIQSSGGDN